MVRKYENYPVRSTSLHSAHPPPTTHLLPSLHRSPQPASRIPISQYPDIPISQYPNIPIFITCSLSLSHKQTKHSSLYRAVTRPSIISSFTRPSALSGLLRPSSPVRTILPPSPPSGTSKPPFSHNFGVSNLYPFASPLHIPSRPPNYYCDHHHSLNTTRLLSYNHSYSYTHTTPIIEAGSSREATHDTTRVASENHDKFLSIHLRLTGHSPAIVSINIIIPSLSFSPSQPVHLSTSTPTSTSTSPLTMSLPRCLSASLPRMQSESVFSQSPQGTHASSNPSHDPHPTPNMPDPSRSISHLVTQIFFPTATGYPL